MLEMHLFVLLIFLCRLDIVGIFVALLEIEIKACSNIRQQVCWEPHD